MKNTKTYEFNNLKLKITEILGEIVEVDYTTKTVSLGKETPTLLLAKQQLEEYFDGMRTNFNLPLRLVGTPFQIKVWNALLETPFGATTTYKNISEKINHPKSYRAVGGACNKNIFLIVVPCHRVVGSNNSLVGYAEGLDLKERLLSFEKKTLKNNKDF